MVNSISRSGAAPDSKPLEFERFGNCGEFATIRIQANKLHLVLIPSNSTGLEFDQTHFVFNSLEFEGIGSQRN